MFKQLKFDILVTTTTNLCYLLENGCFKSIAHKVYFSDIVVDKVDLHTALDVDGELVKVGQLVQQFAYSKTDPLYQTKTVITTNEQEAEDVLTNVKTAFLNDRKSVIVKLKEQKRSATMYESIGHFVVECKKELEKYIILYSFLKLRVIRERTLIFVDNIYEAYKLKIFLEKFFIRSAVVNPEATKLHRKSAVRYFQSGQYDLLILIRMKYSFKLRLNSVHNVINFTTPQNIQDYDSAFKKLNVENGSVLTLTYSDGAQVVNNDEYKYMYSLVKKMLKRFDRSLFVVLPINWLEVNKLKSRVDDIFCTLTAKKIKEYMSNEIKKQILNSKKLKEYFDEHEDEKEILRASVDSNYKFRFLNNNLDFVPDYLMPESLIMSEIEKELNTFKPSQPKMQTSLHELPNDLPFIHNLKNLPKRAKAKVERYDNPDITGMLKILLFSNFIFSIDVNRLEHLSGRKLWKLKHKKRIHKKQRKAKDGYQGS